MRAACLCVAVCMVAGCDVGPALVPVTGTVLRDGKPLAACDVIFVPDPPDTKRQPAEAKTGPDGRYKIATGDRWGVAPGKYRVTISKGAKLLNGKVGESPQLESQFLREVPPMGVKYDFDVARPDQPPSF